MTLANVAFEAFEDKHGITVTAFLTNGNQFIGPMDLEQIGYLKDLLTRVLEDNGVY